MSTLELKELSHPAGEVIKIAAGKTLDLKSQGTTTLPTGSVLQVVQGTTTTLVESTSNSWVATTLTATITPQFSSSKILVIVDQNLRATSGWAGFRLQRDTTTIKGADYVMLSAGTFTNNIQIAYNQLDSPATTSALTYNTDMKSTTASSSKTQDNSAQATMILMEIQG
jgi:hypothetical protein